MILRFRHTIMITALGLYAALFLHDLHLYPNLTIIGTLFLSLLRFGLIAVPVALGFVIVRRSISVRSRTVAGALWVLLVPYTIYSITEIRHIAEVCRLREVVFYTEQCVAQSWTLIPTFAYAGAGVLAFVFTTSQVISALMARSLYKRAVMLALCGYAAFASVFGLYTRINVWVLFTKPALFLHAFVSVFAREGFLENVAWFFVFYAGILFALNRILRRAGHLIVDAQWACYNSDNTKRSAVDISKT